MAIVKPLARLKHSKALALNIKRYRIRILLFNQ